MVRRDDSAESRRPLSGYLILSVALVLTACSAPRPPRDVRAEQVPQPSVAPAEMREVLEAHNRRRAQHCAPPLAWSEVLAADAQGWADSLRDRGCAFEHSQSGLGENLAAGTEGMLDGEAVTEMWYREVAEFDFRRGGFAMETGHFTQLVWVGTEQIGCAVAQCDGLDLWVCNYDPPGNVEGRYRENVLPTSCR